MSQVEGTFGLAVIHRQVPGQIVIARRGSPLIIGVGEDGNFAASDISAMVRYTKKVVHLNDNELALLTEDGISISTAQAKPIEWATETVEWQAEDAELNGFPHFMLKEIFEQPETALAAMRGRLSRDDATAILGGLNLTPQQLGRVDRIVLTACGTSWHAALVGEYLIEELARIPVEVEYASELRYRNPPMDTNTLVFAITQSGETADTLAALREMKRKGHRTLAICNVIGSTIAQEADGGVYLHAGTEIGVASTKAFTSQCVVLALLALYFGRMRHLSYTAGRRIIRQLEQLPEQISRALDCNAEARRIAAKYCHCTNFLYLGRHYNFPTALEGALKLKEISYIHAEGYPAAEMKHGPIALVDENLPVVVLAPNDAWREKTISNLREVKSREGISLVVTTREDEEVSSLADWSLVIPETIPELQPIVSVVPLQLLAYHVAVRRGCDVDQPRNLAKSVTVE
jgi:glucosamine--fructose-6-phosphate aminotransferase (isomerizing)